MIKTLLTCFALLFVQLVNAQDGHYWTEPYGNRSMLLNGVVSGTVDDLGAVYYNPARLGFVDKPAFLISAKVYQYTTLKFKDGLGENIDISESDFGGAPSLIAGTFKVKFMPKQKFAYSILTRNRSDLDIFLRTESEGEIVEKLPGEEIFSGTVKIQSNFKEEWMGLSIAHPFNKKISIGVTNFLSIRSQKDLFNMQLQALSKNDSSVAVFIRDRSVKLNAYSLLWKVGLAWNTDKFSAGLTITTPKINLTGKGTFLYEDFLVGVDTTGNGINDDIYVTNIQKDREAQLKMPWSIGLGIGIPIGKSRIHLAAEWFDKVDKFTVIAAEPFLSQSNGETINSRIVDELESVINFGIGVELYMNKKLSMYYSFATDYSAIPSDISRLLEFGDEYSNSTFQPNIWHTGGGFLLKNNKIDITLGATYSFANETFERPLTIPDDNNVDVDPNANTQMTLGQWRFLFGISLPFLKDIGKKKEPEGNE